MKSIQELLSKREAEPEEALGLFDGLGPVELDFMLGRWKGFEIRTGHFMDGLLEHSGWYGKLFAGPEEVHPLLIRGRGGKSLYAVNPGLIPLNINYPKSRVTGILMGLLKPIIKTKKPMARMRMVEFRGKITGAMVYDQKAIIDVFAKIDDRRMLGIMDMKGRPEPFVFVLERDDESPYHLEF